MSALLDGGGVLPALLLATLASVVFWYGVLAGVAAGSLAPASPHAATAPSSPPSQPAADEDGAAEAPAPEARHIRPLLMLASSFGPIATVAGLVFLYVPATLALLTFFDRLGSFGVAFRRDFGGLLVCSLSAYAVAFLPVGLLGAAGSVPAPVLLALVGVAVLGFAALMVVALQTACGANLGPAIATVAVSWLSFGLQGFLLFLASPWLLLLRVPGDAG